MGELDPNTDEVTSGPFKAGSWTLVVNENGDTGLRRALGRAQFQDPNNLATSLPIITQVNNALNVTPYDKPQ